METQLLNKGKQMEIKKQPYKSPGDLAIEWAIEKYARVDEFAEQLKDHWLEIHDLTELTDEEVKWRMLPIALSILEKHEDFASGLGHWDW